MAHSRSSRTLSGECIEFEISNLPFYAEEPTVLALLGPESMAVTSMLWPVNSNTGKWQGFVVVAVSTDTPAKILKLNGTRVCGRPVCIRVWGKKRTRGDDEPRVDTCRTCGDESHGSNECPFASCNRCYQKGHTTVTCPRRLTHPRPSAGGEGGERGAAPTPSESFTCNICHKEGHIARNCHSVQCRNCGELGHMSRACTKPPQQPEAAAPKPKKTSDCHICGQAGHFARHCPAKDGGVPPTAQSDHSSVPVPADPLVSLGPEGDSTTSRDKCRICGQPGHFARHCPAKDGGVEVPPPTAQLNVPAPADPLASLGPEGDSTTSRDKCRICGQPGHFARHCPAKNNPPGVAPPTQPYVATSHPTQPSADDTSSRDKCRICGQTGHFARQCPTKTSATEQAPSSEPAVPPVVAPTPALAPSGGNSGGTNCRICGDPGHFARHCPKK